MLLEYMDGLFSRPNTISTNLKEENGDARSEEQNGKTEDQGAITQPGLEPNLSQPNKQLLSGMGNTEEESKKSEAAGAGFPDADRRHSNASDFYRKIIAKVLKVNEQNSQFPAGQQASRQVHGAEQPVPSSRSEDIEKRIAAQKPTIKSDLGENTEALSLE